MAVLLGVCEFVFHVWDNLAILGFLLNLGFIFYLEVICISYC